MEEELKEIIHKSHPDYTHDAAQCSYCQIVLLPDLLAFISAYGEAQALAQRERITRAISADRCPECAAGNEPEYHEHWAAWYHGQLLCLGTSARHAIRAQP